LLNNSLQQFSQCFAFFVGFENQPYSFFGFFLFKLSNLNSAGACKTL